MRLKTKDRRPRTERAKGVRKNVFFPKLIFESFFGLWSLVFGLLSFTGCATQTGNVGNLQNFSAPALEAKWIRDGEPIEFEGALWYPADGIESLMDSEVYHISEYKGTQVFIDKLDVRPYERLYTKYGKNQFRYFEKEKQP